MSEREHQILIVDDDPQIHKLLGMALPAPHFRILSAFSAAEAYAQIEQHHPALVILDVMMPKVSGIEVCNYIKENPSLKDVLVLILSAKDSQLDRIDGLKHGADDYVAKPFHIRHLVRKIEHMLSRR